MKIAVIGLDQFPQGKKNLPDERLDKLTDIYHARKTIPIQIEFIDASRLKEADAVICEKNSKLDLVIGDLEIAEQRMYKEETKELFTKCKDALEKETLLCEIPLSEDEKKILLNSNLVTIKPLTIIDANNMPDLPQIIKDAYSNAGMMAFLTACEKEVRAWPVKKGAVASEAAGVIHSDIQRGFIKAEVIGYEDLVKAGGENQAKNAGYLRLEDKEYAVKDGDIMHFRFSV
ncbi:MAG: DUF933 domain-containing protein [Candidatus Omnitrophota bacterium]|jgi:hypothetical protein